MSAVDNSDNTARGQDKAAALLQSLTEGKELEKWQQYFCNLANVFVCCVDGVGNPLTEFGGNKDEIGRIKRLIDNEQFWNMLIRVSESALEDQAIETTAYPNLRFAVISSKVNRKPVINWLVCGVLTDAQDVEDYENPPLSDFQCQISEKQFAKAVDTLRDISNELISYKQMIISAQAQSRKSRSSEKEMEEKLRRSEALTEVVQLLAHEEETEKITQKLLEIVGTYLKLSIAAVYCKARRGQSLELTSEWGENNVDWELLRKPDEESCKFLKVEKPLFLFYESIRNKQEREQMDKLGLKAVIVIPVEMKGTIGRYACFGKTYKDRAWQLEEIRFVNDSVKVLQSILTRRTPQKRASGKSK